VLFLLSVSTNITVVQHNIGVCYADNENAGPTEHKPVVDESVVWLLIKLICGVAVILTVFAAIFMVVGILVAWFDISLMEGGNVGPLPSLIVAAICAIIAVVGICLSWKKSSNVRVAVYVVVVPITMGFLIVQCLALISVLIHNDDGVEYNIEEPFHLLLDAPGGILPVLWIGVLTHLLVVHKKDAMKILYVAMIVPAIIAVATIVMIVLLCLLIDFSEAILAVIMVCMGMMAYFLTKNCVAVSGRFLIVLYVVLMSMMILGLLMPLINVLDISHNHSDKMDSLQDAGFIHKRGNLINSSDSQCISDVYC
jgi:hypothetical protein